MDNKVKLGYWAIRGIAERIRMILEYIELPYDQILESKTDRDHWFNDQKPKLMQKNPAVTLPYLLDGDRVISESDAIIIYIIHKAKRLELLGRNAE